MLLILDLIINKTINTMKVNDILNLINNCFNVKIEEKTKKRFVVECRYIFAKIIYDKQLFTLEEIGKFINKDHSTISFYLLQHDKFVTNEKYRYRENYEKIKTLISIDYHCLKNMELYSVNDLECLNKSEFVIFRYKPTETIKHIDINITLNT